MKKGNCHRALKDWKERGGERRGEERKKGKVARKEGQEKRKREKRQKVHGLPLGLEPRPVASADHRLAVAATEWLVTRGGK